MTRNSTVSGLLETYSPPTEEQLEAVKCAIEEQGLGDVLKLASFPEFTGGQKHVVEADWTGSRDEVDIVAGNFRFATMIADIFNLESTKGLKFSGLLFLTTDGVVERTQKLTVEDGVVHHTMLPVKEEDAIFGSIYAADAKRITKVIPTKAKY